ncbi:MaoC family dehydratase [Streptomyces sp. RK75]|uniref:MaoC family dehydratase n=1 Tax=Streptomyces sp. RK75 TaxID=2824895 RepID=UPI0027DB1DD5|nr:MaoC family dehydratase [Streptomyces sp. RK75]
MSHTDARSRTPAMPSAGPEEGDQLPPLEIPVTRTLIVSGALASRDFQDVHHDTEAAHHKGSPDIFMNILTTNGLVGRYVVGWAGPYAVLRKVAVRLGAPNYPGDTMALSGHVTAVTPPAPDAPEGEGATVEIVVRGTNRLGDHVTGTVTVTLRESPTGQQDAPPSARTPKRTADHAAEREAEPGGGTA